MALRYQFGAPKPGTSVKAASNPVTSSGRTSTGFSVDRGVAFMPAPQMRPTEIIVPVSTITTGTLAAQAASNAMAMSQAAAAGAAAQSSPVAGSISPKWSPAPSSGGGGGGGAPAAKTSSGTDPGASSAPTSSGGGLLLLGAAVGAWLLFRKGAGRGSSIRSRSAA